MPIIDDSGQLFGALAVLKDVTELVALAEEITDLKEVRMMLEAIIHSSEEAISVVDENGNGILINPAYTRLTGLKEEDVIGKPATADIAEGESMHMQVLKTRRPVRGARMKVGPKNRDVIVNVAPIIVDGVLKGSVGVIHDVSEIQRLTAELNRARQIIRNLEAKYSFADIIGESEEMKVAIEQAKLAAKTPATILLRGESGTGKELFAHAIHNASDRKYNKFIRVNCAAIPETLLESELFGYEEGAFSGRGAAASAGCLKKRTTAAFFLTKLVNYQRARKRSCFAFCRSEKSFASAGRSRFRSTSASSPRPTSIWKKRSLLARFAKIYTIGSTGCRFPFRRCVPARKIFRRFADI